MASFPEALCSHLSVPVEMDESMTSSSLNLAWPVCEQCSTHPEGYSSDPESGSEVMEPACSLVTPPSDRRRILNEAADGYLHHLQRPPMTGPDSVAQPPLVDDLCEGFSALFPRERWNPPTEEDEESLELPLPLRSDVGEIPYGLAPQLRHPRHPGPPGHCQLPPGGQVYRAEAQCPRFCPCQRLLVDPAWLRPEYRPSPPNPVVPMATPQVTSPQLMSEVSVLPSLPVAGHAPFQEGRRTISLPEDCRTVFITYSVDTAKEIFLFVSFLMHHGFRPAIDIFDHAVQQMDVNKWMDGYLKDKSVLIIVVISPKYKMDVEGDGSDQHGLHTKYIHTQIQNEFIQQRCLNFRLVPVLFPNANQSHVPMWLQSTRLFRWPQDAQDLLLRLLREERYIPPPLGKELTLTIKPL
ncbi:adapter protein CIKS isoform X2 [Colossoma macropomum]|uniref:adapter protein CIKS isoform X2 n=1 Tax=Colossoma macropomum TaxID=42526 RepID=UPI00186537CF|nr:adapter protein CIKS isoform X2 [Colossoma macropomum]XP_036438427.1 adapter protein CIKS isoform X2 [Colossoma macropomum]XP_036438428.1 adapter protein CIKS isoform X2 [Colossoma macropomum]